MIVRSSEDSFDFDGGKNQFKGLVTSNAAPQGAGTMSQFTSNEGKDGMSFTPNDNLMLMAHALIVRSHGRSLIRTYFRLRWG